MTAASNFLESSSIEHFMRGNTVASSSAYLSLYKSSPGEDDSGTEVTGAGYFSRMLLNFEVPTAGTSSISTKVGLTASEDLGLITHFGIHDSALTGSGNLLAYGQLSSSLSGTSGNIISFESGSITLTWGDNITQTFGNQLINHFFRETEQVSSSLYVGLATSDPGVNGITSEVGTGDYSRQAIALSSPQVDGEVSSSLQVDFNASSAWGTVSHGVIFQHESALTAAFYKAFAVPRTINDGDIFRFSIGKITIKVQ